MNQKIIQLNKSRAGLLAVVLLAAILAVIYLWPTGKELHRTESAPVLAQVETVFAFTQPLPEHIELDANKVALGEKLFHDPRLSADDTISCASCHNLATGGMDGRVHSIGINGMEGNINAPTVFNSGFNAVQFWDGRALTLEDQIDGPLNNPKEMASNWPQVLAKLSKDTDYPAQFSKQYNNGISIANIKDAIATFERSLVTPNSRFDKFLRGDEIALSGQEKYGYELFQTYGCSSCHQGVNLGGNMYEKMGLMGDYFGDRGHLTEADNGHFNVNQNPDSMNEFRVPSLRNVALTAPYFHDGTATTLEQAIAVMAQYQLGRSMPKQDVDAIAAFLRSLTGEYQGKPL